VINFDLNKIELFNFPRRLKKVDYENLCSLVVADLKLNPDIVAVYLAGRDWVPGISDLDIVVVYKNRRQGRYNITNPWSLSKEAEYVFMHVYSNYTEASFKDLHYLYPTFDKPKLLYGSPASLRLPEEELTDIEHKWLQSSFIFDFLINQLLLYFRYNFKNKINVREVIVVISSLVYTISMVEKITNSKIETNFPQKIASLRNSWFTNSREKNTKFLFSLLGEAESLILKIVQLLTGFLEKEIPDIAKEMKESTFCFRNSHYDLIFMPNWSEKIFLAEFKKGLIEFNPPFFKKRKDIDSYRLALPSPLFFFLENYTRVKGSWSDWLKKNVKNNQLSIKIPVNKGIKEHALATNRYISECITSGDKVLKLWLTYGFFPYPRSIKRKIADSIVLFLRKLKK